MCVSRLQTLTDIRNSVIKDVKCPPFHLFLLLYKDRNLGMICIINMYAQTTLIYCDATKRLR